MTTVFHHKITHQKVEGKLEFLKNVDKLAFMWWSGPHGEETFPVILLLTLFRPIKI